MPVIVFPELVCLCCSRDAKPRSELSTLKRTLEQTAEAAKSRDRDNAQVSGSPSAWMTHAKAEGQGASTLHARNSTILFLIELMVIAVDRIRQAPKEERCGGVDRLCVHTRSRALGTRQA